MLYLSCVDFSNTHHKHNLSERLLIIAERAEVSNLPGYEIK